MKPNHNPDEIKKCTLSILSMRKYADLNLPLETAMDLLEREIKNGKSMKEAEKGVREKLHQMIAPYLGNPDYTSEMVRIEQVFANGDPDAKLDWCTQMLNSHASTLERFPNLTDFYQKIFALIGQPESIADFACAMNPFSIPWMGLPSHTTYTAYDLHTPRVDLLNQFFQRSKTCAQAFVQDILLETPSTFTQVAFFFKEAHRFEARRKGSCRDFFNNIQARWIVVTLPAQNLTGQHQMRERQRSLMEKSMDGRDWSLVEMEVADEMIFVIDKQRGEI